MGQKTEWLINRLGRNRLTVNKECTAQKELGFSYSVFGLHLRSYCPLPGVSPRDFTTDNFDVALHVGFSPDLARTNPLPAEELLYTSPETNAARSEEHTSELQSHLNIVCRLLLEKK